MSTTAIAFFVATKLHSGNGKKVYLRIKGQSLELDMTDNTQPLTWLQNPVLELNNVVNEPCYFYMAKNPEGLTFIDSTTKWPSNDANGATILVIPQNGKEITCRDE
eukprot:GHVU01061574.1.p1 GENE.GHVU01061574.1~~GHVU01061574.1.p1  ORF type:complete len:106 (-),score=8.69 GHVU01061574.1:328-645(-)